MLWEVNLREKKKDFYLKYLCLIQGSVETIHRGKGQTFLKFTSKYENICSLKCLS